MAGYFNEEQWTETKNKYRTWWAGESDRPMLHFTVMNEPAAPAPELPLHSYFTFYEDVVSPAQIINRFDHEMQNYSYLGAGFPALFMNFGAGIIAGMMGARVENGENTVWFHPPADRELADISLKADMSSYWYKRVKDILQAAMDKWQGAVQVSMADLGGNLDILSTFRPGEKLLMDLYDNPDQVKRLTDEAHAAWWEYFTVLDAVLHPQNPGYTTWMPMLSETPSYLLQCDFCFMISPDMFDEFAKPELAASCAKLDNAFYHLDGPGELPHLDSLLEIDGLKGVQWIAGAGQKPAHEWMDVYHKIERAGRNVQVFGGLDEIDAILEQADNPGRYFSPLFVKPEDAGKAEALVKKWGW